MADSAIPISTLPNPGPAVSGVVPATSETDVMIHVRDVGKLYRLYDRPQDRLKEQLLWRFGKHFGRPFWALQDISFEIRKGEAVGIIGRNGSGKSTLLQIIASTLTPTTGEARVAGRVAALLELGSGFNLEFTGRENVFLNGTVLGISDEEMAERYGEIVAFADIGEFIDQPVKLYSSGMMMRLAFAVAACVEPEILIIDEALAVGDMAFQQKCFARIEEAKRRGITLLFVSHDIYAVRTYCERAIYLQSGHKLMDGDAETVTEAFLRDIVAEQQRSALTEVTWRTEPGIGTGGFGGKLGKIVSAQLVSRDQSPSTNMIAYGDEIGLKVTAQVDPQVCNPSLSCQVRDYHGYAVSGIISGQLGVEFTPQERANDTICAIFWCPVIFSPGPYSFTVGLTDYESFSVNIVIDKLFGVCPFTVMDTHRLFHGVVDIHARFEKVSLTTKGQQ